jgi:hypothetical protein
MTSWLARTYVARNEETDMTGVEVGRVALVFRGDRNLRNTATPDNTRLAPIFAALAGVGLAAEPSVYSDDMAEEARDQLLDVDGVLVWVDPVFDSEDRTRLDAILREVAAGGAWVSAHPDVIVKMGTKEVLYRTRNLGWGSDVHLYRAVAEFNEAFPASLATGGARVLKQYRGNGGIGVWKVELVGRAASSRDIEPIGEPDPDAAVRVQSARARDEVTEDVSLGEFMGRCEKYFGYSGGEGRLIDQPFQPRITEGMLRCYFVKKEVVGFARQYPKGLSPAELEAGAIDAPAPGRILGLPAAKTMYAPDEPAFQAIRRSLESEWVPAMQAIVDVDDASLPALWDADFLFGPKTDSSEDTYMLCEINVSAVAPFPEQAPPKLAEAALALTRVGAVRRPSRAATAHRQAVGDATLASSAVLVNGSPSAHAERDRGLARRTSRSYP